MSPEQAFGKEVDHRCDAFPLGAVIYRLVAGRDAFSAENVSHILNRIIYEEPEPPSQVDSELPAGIDLVVGRALAKSRETRYPDAKALADDIRDILNGRGPRHRNEVRLPLAGSRVVADDVLEIVDDPGADPLVEIATLASEASDPRRITIRAVGWQAGVWTRRVRCHHRRLPPPPLAGRRTPAAPRGVTRQPNVRAQLEEMAEWAISRAEQLRGDRWTNIRGAWPLRAGSFLRCQ